MAFAALEKEAARIAIESLASLARVNDIDHLGGGLELIPALLMTLAVTDYERSHYTIEHGHTSIGYYSALSALGFLDRARVVDTFRRGLDIAGHVLMGTGRHRAELRSSRRHVPRRHRSRRSGLKAHHGAAAHVICHTGDAGWISGQALNGLNAAATHCAPVTFVMHRNGIQLSGTTRHIMNQDPRGDRRQLRHQDPGNPFAAQPPRALRRVSRSLQDVAGGTSGDDLSDRVGRHRGRSARHDRGVRQAVRHSGRDRQIRGGARRADGSARSGSRARS